MGHDHEFEPKILVYVELLILVKIFSVAFSSYQDLSEINFFLNFDTKCHTFKFGCFSSVVYLNCTIMKHASNSYL